MPEFYILHKVIALHCVGVVADFSVGFALFKLTVC